MKTSLLKTTLLAAMTALAMAPTASHAASDILIQPTGATTMSTGTGNQCNSSGGGGVWQNWYVNTPTGISNYDISFDTTTLPSPNPSGATGSMLQKQGWDGTNGGSMVTYACIDGNFWGGATFDASQYSSVELDFKYDTTSTMTPASAANVEIHMDGHLSNNGPGNTGTGSDGITLTNLVNSGATAGFFDGAWHHVSVLIDSAINPASRYFTAVPFQGLLIIGPPTSSWWPGSPPFLRPPSALISPFPD